MLNREDAAIEVARLATEMLAMERRIAEVEKVLPPDVRSAYADIIEIQRPAYDLPHHQMSALATAIGDAG